MRSAAVRAHGRSSRTARDQRRRRSGPPDRALGRCRPRMHCSRGIFGVQCAAQDPCRRHRPESVRRSIRGDPCRRTSSPGPKPPHQPRKNSLQWYARVARTCIAIEIFYLRRQHANRRNRNGQISPRRALDAGGVFNENREWRGSAGRERFIDARIAPKRFDPVDFRAWNGRPPACEMQLPWRAFRMFIDKFTAFFGN